MNKKISFMVLFIIMMLLPNNLSANLIDQNKILKGIESIGIFVWVDKNISVTGKQVRNDIELKLIQSNIPIDKPNEVPSGKILVTEIYAMPIEDTKIYSIIIHMFFTEWVKLDRINEKVEIISWDSFEMDILDKNKIHKTRDKVKDLLDTFILDYLKANPNKR